MPSVWCYARVSREDQNLALQLDALEAAGVIQAHIVEEKESGARQRPGFDALIKCLQPRDSLHLLQNCIVYVNTLMIQKVLARPEWKGHLTARDLHALTPLFWTHVAPYGRFDLDMQTRITALT